MTTVNEAERLADYHPFDQDVLDTVAEVADRQRRQTWPEMRYRLPSKTLFEPIGGKVIELLDIRPRWGSEATQVYYLPMNNGLDENMSARVATFAAAQPDTRIIAVGNPGAPGQKSNRLHLKDLPAVWKGNLRPTVDPILQYLDANEIGPATHIGYSWGADKASAAAQHADTYDQEVLQSILMEPAGVKERSLIELGKAFASSAEPLGAYVEAANSQAYQEARDAAWETNRGAKHGYDFGLVRLSNIAVARALSRDMFEQRVDEAMDRQEEMKVSIVWGSESELAINSLMSDIVRRLKENHGHLVTGTAIEGQKHAMGDDIFLQTALILQSLKK